MAFIGWFDPELKALSWFDSELDAVAWFDSELIDLSAGGGGITQSLAITLDDVTVSANQSLQHSQSLAITLDGVTPSVTQALQHSQSMAITLDGITPAISQNLRHSQALAITLDGISGDVNQTLGHTQSVAISLDDIAVSITQNAAGSSKTQSLSIALDDVSAAINQSNSSEVQLSDTHDGFWRKQLDKKKKRKPKDAEEIAEFISEISAKELTKPKVIADTVLLELYTQSIALNHEIAGKLERIYQLELDQDDEEVLMLLGVF